MSHRTDRVSLTPLSPPRPHPLYTPPPHREVRGRPLELVPVSGQVQNPLGIHIEPSWCFCHVTERRSDPSITSVEFTAGAADHITNGHQPGEPETEPRRLFWIICRIQESFRNFSSVKSSLLTFLFSPPPSVFVQLMFVCSVSLKPVLPKETAVTGDPEHRRSRTE